MLSRAPFLMWGFALAAATSWISRERAARATFPDCRFAPHSTILSLLSPPFLRSPIVDSHYPHNVSTPNGPYGPVTNYTVMWEGHPMVVIQPTKPPADTPLPLVVFMHSSTGRLSFYDMNLRNYASHGFVVVFPYIKNPKVAIHVSPSMATRVSSRISNSCAFPHEGVGAEH